MLSISLIIVLYYDIIVVKDMNTIFNVWEVHVQDARV